MDARELCEQHGIPVAMLHAAKGLTATIELAGNQRWKGTIVSVDDQSNIELANAQHWDGFSPVRDVKSTIIRGGAVMYFSLPQDEMAALFPMLKRVERATGTGAGTTTNASSSNTAAAASS